MIDLPPALVWAALAIPLLGTGIRMWARWAAGGSSWWLVLGVLLAACGIDGLRVLHGRLLYTPLEPSVRGALWGLISGAVVWAVWREWRTLGRRKAAAAPGPGTSPDR